MNDELKCAIKLPFKCVQIELLESFFREGLIEVSLRVGKHGRPDCLWIKSKQKKIVKVNSVVSSVDSWDELGSLVFELVEDTNEEKNTLILSSDWSAIEGIDKLIYIDDVVYAESGIAIRNAKGNEIIVVSSSLPFSIELFAEFYCDDFTPECELSKYTRQPMKGGGGV